MPITQFLTIAFSLRILYSRHGKVMPVKKILSLILAVMLAVAVSSCAVSSPKQIELDADNNTLLVHFIDVGQGDSILLESRGEFVLIDAGEKEYGSDVVKYIENRGAGSLKYIIATHPHSDHIGGMEKVINSIDAENFITAETDQSTRTWLRVLDAVDKHDLNYIDAEPGSTYSFGEASFTILAPLGSDYGGYNDYSVVTMVNCGSVRFLLAGDAEKQSEKEMLASGVDLHADVLKLGHHGSSTSSTANFLKAVDPTYAIISCGKDNDYGHPHQETIKKLNLLGCTYYRTDELGTIVASTDGVTITFSTAEGALPAPSKSAAEINTVYIGNRNSHVFHLPSCSGVKTMSEKNKVTFDTREEALDQGYTPCSLCDP